MPIHFFHPRYWLTWLGVGILRLIIISPWEFQMSFGRLIGRFLYLTLPARRRISFINLEIAFPLLSTDEIDVLNKQHFMSLGEGVFSTALSWWGKESEIQQISEIEGLDHLLKANEEGGVILVGGHFTSLEIGGRILAPHTRLHTVYRPHQNDLLEYLTAKIRNQQYGKVISKKNIRDMIKSLKAKKIVWYAMDQNYRGKGSIAVPFFGIDTPTNPGTSRLAKMTGAKIVPIFPLKQIGSKKGYLLRILPPLENFPSGDNFEDTKRLNQIIEMQINDFPEQYLWTHKRYKSYGSEGKDFYQDYQINHPELKKL